MADVECPNETVTAESIQESIEQELAELSQWNATLHFEHVEGRIGEKVDLFQYIGDDSDAVAELPTSGTSESGVRYRNEIPSPHPIRFDRNKYPPNEEGIAVLNADLQRIAMIEGSVLINRYSKFQLICNRCRVSSNQKKKHEKTFDPEDMDNGDPTLQSYIDDIDENGVVTKITAHQYDEDGVKIGIREHHYHRNRKFNRMDGKGNPRATLTSRPLSKDFLCKARLSFDIYKGQYIYLCTHVGSKYHVYHAKPLKGSLALHKRHMTQDARQLAVDARRASTGGTGGRWLVMENKSQFVSKGTLRRIQLMPEFLTNPGKDSKKSTASLLVNWLRKMAGNPKYHLGYCILNHKKVGGLKFFSHPKGRPSKKDSRMPLPEVCGNMTYSNQFSRSLPHAEVLEKESWTGSEQVDASESSKELSAGSQQVDDTESGTTTMSDSQPLPHSGYMETIARLPPTLSSHENHTEEFTESESADNDSNARDVERHRTLLKEFHVDAERVLLGAAWIDADGWQQFARFPEVIFCDATHKTNNEGRPLLVVVGRDSNGKAFVILRILMPNETASFYRWVFLTCIPHLIGKEQLKRVRLLITDGDSQEFNAVDEAIFYHFKHALRVRCGYHVVQKTWEKVMGSGVSLGEPSLDKIAHMIKSWVYSWMNGTNCYTPEQYELSRDLFTQFILSDCPETKKLGKVNCNKIEGWVKTKIDDLQHSVVMHKKTYVRCFDEYVNNSGEGMNYAQKFSDMAAKPNKDMETSANAMLNHSQLKARDRKSALSRELYSSPLYLKKDGVHPVDVHAQIVNMARHLIILQFRQRKNYSKLQIEPNKWLVLRNQSGQEQSEVEDIYDCFWRIPKFCMVHVVVLSDNILTCSCGYKHRYGIPCHHLFALEPQYDINDIDCRWHTSYALLAFDPTCPSLTKKYLLRQALEHKGIKMKTLKCNGHNLPYLLPGSERSAKVIVSIHESKVPICWNYTLKDYPKKYHQRLRGGVTDDEFGNAFFEGDDDMWNDDETEEVFGLTQESCTVGVASQVGPSLGRTDVTHAILLTRFKKMLGYFNTPSSRVSLNETLKTLEDERCREHINHCPAELLQTADCEYTSSMLPFDKDKESTCFRTYDKKKWNKSQKNNKRKRDTGK